MKLTNLLLGILTLCCAIGSAVAAKMLVPSPTWVSGVNTLGIPTCSTLGNLCDPATGSAQNCEVRITVNNGTTVSTIGFNSNTCAVPYRTSTAVTATISKPNLRSVAAYDDGNP